MCLEKGRKINASYNDIKQIPQMAMIDKQTKINENSYKLGKRKSPCVKSVFVSTYAFTVNSSLWKAIKG